MAPWSFFEMASVACVSVLADGKKLGTVYLGRVPESNQLTLSTHLTSLLQATIRLCGDAVPEIVCVSDAGKSHEDRRRVEAGRRQGEAKAVAPASSFNPPWSAGTCHRFRPFSVAQRLSFHREPMVERKGCAQSEESGNKSPHSKMADASARAVLVGSSPSAGNGPSESGTLTRRVAGSLLRGWRAS